MDFVKLCDVVACLVRGYSRSVCSFVFRCFESTGLSFQCSGDSWFGNRLSHIDMRVLLGKGNQNSVNNSIALMSFFYFHFTFISCGLLID